MSPRFQNRRLFIKRHRRPPLRAALALCAALAVPLSSLRADVAGQAEITKELLPKGKTILTASAAGLAAAVAAAIDDPLNLNTPADLAASALQPVNGVVRKDRNTSAPLVAASAIDALIASGTNASFGADAAGIADSLVDVNSGNPEASRQTLSTAGQAAVVKAALGVISDAAVSDSSLLAADQVIGQVLATDPALEDSALARGALTVILQDAITGIAGLKGKAQSVAPEAAENFVEGLLASTGPDAASLPTFAVTILKKVSKNTSVDELVAYQVGLLDNGSQASLVNLAVTLFAAYPSAATKLTQGLAAVTPPGVNNETQRIAYIQALVTARVKDAVPVLMGAIFVDPFYAGQFTNGIFNTLLASGSDGVALLVSNASRIAAGAGSVLGQDGDVLTQVADVFGRFIGSGDLPAAKAASYATALINGAIRSAVPASQFTGAAAGAGGGRLNTGAGITFDTVTDLSTILDLLADGIVTSNPPNAASQVGLLAATVARFTRNELFVDPNKDNLSTPVAAFLAGTLADFMVQLGLGAVEQKAVLEAIGKAVTGVTNTKVDAQVRAAIAGYSAFPAGAITVQETAVTNL